MASTGVARMKTRLTVYIDQTNKGSRNQVMPLVRRRCVVAMKLMPVAMEEKPARKIPPAAAKTGPAEKSVE